MYTGCSGTLRHMCADTALKGADPSSLAWMLATYTPRGFTCSAECHGRVVDFVHSWASAGGSDLPAGFTPTWEALVGTFAAHPRRAHLDALWRASCDGACDREANHEANPAANHDAWRCGWLAVMRAADFWDMPCLYWHMVYLCHERGPPRLGGGQPQAEPLAFLVESNPRRSPSRSAAAAPALPSHKATP